MKYVVYNRLENYFIDENNCICHDARQAKFYTNKTKAMRAKQILSSSDFVVKTITAENYKKLMSE